MNPTSKFAEINRIGHFYLLFEKGKLQKKQTNGITNPNAL
jgi:hypothetical protein